MKKYLYLALFGVAAWFAYKKYFAKTVPSGTASSAKTTGTATAVPTVPTPYNAAAITAKQNKFTAQTATDYLGAAGQTVNLVKGFFGNSSNATGTTSPATSGSGTSSPLVYDTTAPDATARDSDNDLISEYYNQSDIGDSQESFGGSDETFGEG